ncbi:MAG: SO_0444 family Cu/Zn efflux transporter, partial [Bacteroidaceae bacterium]|nr:SO_0444 family Cu/Zn efflux transporter [Bacteroidaceae bacterium]
VVYAALFGIPLPLCSCGVIPTAMSLRREGASKGATVSFLIATPQTGIDSIIATYSLMGLPFAIIRPIAALLTAIVGGQMVNAANGGYAPSSALTTPSGSHCHESGHSHDCGCTAHHEEHSHNCGCTAHSHHSHNTFAARIREAFRYGFVEMMEDIGKWLVVGLVVAGLITVLVPDSWFAVFKGNTLLSMILVLCISVPMYICATGSIPIAVALMLKGLTPGAALVLLMAGPACNVASILVINKVLGRRTLLAYLFSIIVGSIVCGIAVDHLLPAAWFLPSVASVAGADGHGDLEWWGITSTVVLILLLANALWRHRHHCHCHCEG